MPGEKASDRFPSRLQFQPSVQEFPFTIEPKQLELEVGETKELSVSCFPVAWFEACEHLRKFMGRSRKEL